MDQVLADTLTANLKSATTDAKRRADEARAAWERANLPPDLAALREAQRQAATTQEVTVVIRPEAK